MKAYEKIKISTVIQSSGLSRSEVSSYLAKLVYSNSIRITIDEAGDLIEIDQNDLTTEYKIDLLKSNYKGLLGLQEELISLDLDHKIRRSSHLNFN